MTIDLTRVEIEFIVEALDDQVDRLFARAETLPDGDAAKARIETQAVILEDIADSLVAVATAEEEETVQ